MKKIIFRLLLVVVLLVIAAGVAGLFFLDDIVKRGIETVGSKVTKVTVKLDSVNLSLLAGSGKIKGFVLGNPEGFSSPSAISAGLASLSLEPKSVLSDKVVIKSIVVDSPEIYCEQTLSGNNLLKLKSNLSSGSAEPQASAPAGGAKSSTSKGFEVDQFILTGARIHVSLGKNLGGQSATTTLPDIKLKDLGKGPQGITAEELTVQVLQAVLDAALAKSTDISADLSKGGVYFSNQAKAAATNEVRSATQGLKDLLNGK